MKTTKTVKHDGQVQAFIADGAAPATGNGAEVDKAAIAAIAELAHDAMAPAPLEGPVAPTTPQAPATGTVSTATALYCLGAAAGTVRNGNTLQGAHLKAGKAWRQAGFTAPSVRNSALSALAALGPTFTKDQALAALKEIADAGGLGCSTPATRFSKFLRSGHVAPVAA